MGSVQSRPILAFFQEDPSNSIWVIMVKGKWRNGQTNGHENSTSSAFILYNSVLFGYFIQRKHFKTEDIQIKSCDDF